LCIEVLRYEHGAEPVVVVVITIVVIEREEPGIAICIVIVATYEHWVARSHEVSVVQFNP